MPKRNENICPHKNLYMNVYSSIIPNIQKVETTQMPFNTWVEKEKVLYTYNRILFSFKKNNFIYLFIYVCCRSSLLCTAFSLVAENGGCSSLWCFLLLWHIDYRHVSFSSSSIWAQELWLPGLAAPEHVGSSCIARWILHHCATREAPI